MATTRRCIAAREKKSFFSLQRARARVRKANACAQAAYHTRDSCRPAQHRFRSSVHNRRKPIGSALQSTKTLPTVRVPARTDSYSVATSSPFVGTAWIRGLIVTCITMSETIPELETTPLTTGNVNGWDPVGVPVQHNVTLLLSTLARAGSEERASPWPSE